MPVYTLGINHRGRFTRAGEYFVPVTGRRAEEASRSLFTALLSGRPRSMTSWDVEA
jgi:hypothetical protein